MRAVAAPRLLGAHARKPPRVRRAGVEELINLQRDGDKVKVYQVRQVRAVLVRYGLTTIEGDEE